MKERTLIIVRHAHRDTSEGRERDNGLSEKGSEQAKAVARFFKERFGKTVPLLLSSPKVRCIETLLPLADRTQTEVKVTELLDEQHESKAEYERRIQKFFRWWKQRGPELTVACSHGDWIPSFTQIAAGVAIELKKGGWLEFEGAPKEFSLRWVMQTLQ